MLPSPVVSMAVGTCNRCSIKCQHNHAMGEVPIVHGSYICESQGGSALTSRRLRGLSAPPAARAMPTAPKTPRGAALAAAGAVSGCLPDWACRWAGRLLDWSSDGGPAALACTCSCNVTQMHKLGYLTSLIPGLSCRSG